MKKLSYLAIALALTLSLTACGSKSEPDNAPISDTPASAPADIENNIDNNTTLRSSEFVPLEIEEYSYSMHKKYVYCMVKICNPNENYAVQYPTFRVTAKDGNGLLLGTADQTLSVLYPGQSAWYAGMCFDVEETPDTFTVEAVQPDDYCIVSPVDLDLPEAPKLKVENAVLRDGNVLGEVTNESDYDIRTVIVAVIFRDADGKVVDGNTGFVDRISAGSSAPFSVYASGDYSGLTIEAYAYSWD